MAMNLNRDEWFIGLMFGVFIDIDHVFAIPRYVQENGFLALLTPTLEDPSGHPWKSLLHRPVGAFIMMPLSVGWRFFFPALFWGVHMCMDIYQTACDSYPVIVEAALFIGACAGIAVLGYTRAKGTDLTLTPRGYLERSLSMVFGSRRYSA